MRKTSLFALTLALVLVAGACGAKEQSMEDHSAQAVSAEYHKITPEEAKTMMEQEGIVILDVRTAEEFKAGHIENAVLIPDTELADRAAEELPDLEQTILVYCRSGRRSAAAAKALVERGYTAVYDFGGILDWPYDTVQ